tara:strand:+ start:118 stop:540 length:423 start_codon:yes stop_codon:yes gene_type:complete
MKFSDKNYIRPDVIFSYWIFAYAIVYFLGFKKYNPLLLLIIGLFHNVGLFFLYLKLKEIKWAWLLVFVNFWIKIVPIFFLRNTTIVWNDVYFSLIYFLIFLAYISTLYYVFKVKTAFSMIDSSEVRPGIFQFYVNKLLNL